MHFELLYDIEEGFYKNIRDRVEGMERERVTEATLSTARFNLFQHYQAAAFLLRINRSPAIAKIPAIAMRPHSESVGIELVCTAGWNTMR